MMVGYSVETTVQQKDLPKAAQRVQQKADPKVDHSAALKASQKVSMKADLLEQMLGW